MACVEHRIDTAPSAVFEVLADPRAYAYWVIGSIEIREADERWPDLGSRFHHTVGMGPLRVRDYTEVEKVEPGCFLQLKTRARPLGNARVTLTLEPEGGGTRVRMTEEPADRPTAIVFNPATDVLVHRRNERSLERLAELAEGRRPIPGDEPGASSKRPQSPGVVQNPEQRRRWTGKIPLRVAAGLGAVGCVGAVAALWKRTS